MSFITSTLPTTTEPSPRLIIDIVEPQMTACGWVKMSTNVTASSYVWNVYKSPSACNSIAKDFHLALGWDVTTNANLYMTIFEGWDNATANAWLYVPKTAPTPLANGYANAFISALPNISASNIGLVGTGSGVTQSPLSQSGCIYYISATSDRVIIATSNNSLINAGAAFYGGVYDSLMSPQVDSSPLCVINFNATSVGTPPNPFIPSSTTLGAIFVREPSQASACTSNFYGGVAFPLNYGNGQGNPETYSNKYFVTRGVLQGRATASIRGMPKDIFYTSLAAVNRGDEIRFVKDGITTNAISINSGTAQFVSVYRPYMANV